MNRCLSLCSALVFVSSMASAATTPPTTAESLVTGPVASTNSESEASTSLTSVEKTAQTLIRAVSSGAEKSCAPTHLTVSGNASDGTRLYVSSLVNQFSADLRRSARGSAKLTKVQAREMQRLVDYATSSQKTGDNFPHDAIEQIAALSGLKIQASMLCLSRESFSAGNR